MNIELHETQELNEISNKLIDGLIFCRKIYKIFENIKRSKNGIDRLRLRKSDLEKKLIEELLPLSRYIQMKYSPGRKIKIKWTYGNQPCDAYILSSGLFVDIGEVSRKYFLEVTTAVHQNDYLCRQYLHEQGHCWGPKGTKRDKITKEIISKPYAWSGYEHADDFGEIIIKRIIEKNNKNYPENTLLLIWCQLNYIFSDSEWDHMVDKVKNSQLPNNFKEISLFDSNYRFFNTLYF